MSYLLMEQGRFLNGMCLLAVDALRIEASNSVFELIHRWCHSTHDSFSIHFARSFVAATLLRYLLKRRDYSPVVTGTSEWRFLGSFQLL